MDFWTIVQISSNLEYEHLSSDEWMEYIILAEQFFKKSFTILRAKPDKKRRPSCARVLAVKVDRSYSTGRSLADPFMASSSCSIPLRLFRYLYQRLYPESYARIVHHNWWVMVSRVIYTVCTIKLRRSPFWIYRFFADYMKQKAS